MSGPYGPLLLEHFRRPRNFGVLDAPDAEHEVLNPLCGDRIRMGIAVTSGAVTEVRFRGDACAICIASASLLTEAVRSASMERARQLGEAEVLGALPVPIPDSRRRCALLPLEALQGCLAALASGAEVPRSPASRNASST